MDLLSIKGFRSETEYYEVEKGAIRQFATALNETNPIYFDEELAKEKGYPSLIAPITFPTTFRSKPPEWFVNLDRNKLLHGSQEFIYERRMFAGDRIRVEEEVSDVFEKQGQSKMTFIVRERKAYDESNRLVYTEKMTLIINGG